MLTPQPSEGCVPVVVSRYAPFGLDSQIAIASKSLQLQHRIQPMKLSFLAGLVLAVSLHALAADSEAGFVKIFDGKTFQGWKPAEEHTDTWKIEEGAFVAHGDRCHLYYIGDEKPFKNFELKVDVMTEPNSNGGIYFHTRYQPVSWPKYGFECQVNVSHGDWIKTGSLYGLVNLGWTPAKDRQWWTQHIKVQGNTVTVKVDGLTVLE